VPEYLYMRPEPGTRAQHSCTLITCYILTRICYLPVGTSTVRVGIGGSSPSVTPLFFKPCLALVLLSPGGASSVIVNLAWMCSKNSRLGTKRMGRPSADDPCTPRAERPPRQPRTLSVTVVGCSMGIWARTLPVDRGMDGFRGPSGAHFVVCSLLVLGPKYQILPTRRFCATETPEKRNAWMRNG